MEADRFPKFNIGQVRTPSFVIDEGLLEKNLKILKNVKQATGAKILLALKAYSTFSTFPLIKKYLDGVCASSPHEARLGHEEFGKEVVVAAPAYTDEHIRELVKHSTAIIFNSFGQYKKYKKTALQNDIKCGIRVNPEHSEAPVPLYNPCGPCSRLGVTIKNFEEKELGGISGLHFHALCEQGADALERVLKAFEKKFGKYIGKMEWVNLGGGHHITKEGYDIDLLCRIIKSFKIKHGIEVYLEPGEAVALNAGFLVASVVDIIENEAEIAILDTSAETHMPDVLAMPYTPRIIGAKIASSRTEKDKKNFPHKYRLGGMTCLAGDIIGDYAFPKKLEVGSKIVFTDMAIYSMVKTTTFNGVNLPSIAINRKNGEMEIVKEFGYGDFKGRLS